MLAQYPVREKRKKIPDFFSGFSFLGLGPVHTPYTLVGGGGGHSKRGSSPLQWDPIPETGTLCAGMAL
jgi:hypothetical protein